MQKVKVILGKTRIRTLNVNMNATRDRRDVVELTPCHRLLHCTASVAMSTAIAHHLPPIDTYNAMGDYTEQINKQIVIENFEFEGVPVLSVTRLSKPSDNPQSNSEQRRCDDGYSLA